MKNRNKPWLIGGAISLFTFFVHLIGGQITLVDPLLNSGLDLQVRTEWLAAWHIVTVFLLFASVVLLRSGLNPQSDDGKVVEFISWCFVGFGVVFIAASVFQQCFAPQWILLIPIGVLGLSGARKLN